MDFIEACHSGSSAAVQRHIDDGADVNAPDEIGWTPLMDAAGYNPDPDVIITLLAAGANAKAKNRDGETAFDIGQRNSDLRGTDALRKLEEASKYAPITQSNWINDPRIVTIRGIVAAIEDDIRRKLVTEKSHEEASSQPDKDVFRQAFVDRDGNVEKLVRVAGATPSPTKWTYYYDGNQHLRFVYVEATAANGTRYQDRIYLDESAARFWEVFKTVSGPGFQFPREWPNGDMVLSPHDLSLDQW